MSREVGPAGRVLAAGGDEADAVPLILKPKLCHPLSVHCCLLVSSTTPVEAKFSLKMGGRGAKSLHMRTIFRVV